jgi:hypothetical protein
MRQEFIDDFGKEFVKNMKPVNESATPSSAYTNDVFEKPTNNEKTESN